MEAGGSKTDSSLGASGYIQRCVIIQRDDKGYGLTVRGDNPVYVESVKAGGAAQRSGVRQGDRIVKVNGTLVTNSSHSDVTKLIKSGSFVALTLLNKSNVQQLKDVTVPLHGNPTTILDGGNTSESPTISPSLSPTSIHARNLTIQSEGNESVSSGITKDSGYDESTQEGGNGKTQQSIQDIMAMEYDEFSDEEPSGTTALSNLVQKIHQQPASTPIPEDDNVPAEIKLMSDRKSVPLYLRLLESGSEKKRDVRLVIVGEKGAGKTSFLKRLFGEDIREVTSTDGIEIHKIKCHAESNEGVWKKIEGCNEETELHTRLLKPYEKKLQSQIKGNIDTSVGIGSLNDTKVDTNPTDSKETHEMTKSKLNSASQPPESTLPDEQPEKSFDQAYKEIKSMLKYEVDLHDNEEYATFLLWDFAGDEEFYHTHQTFLSKDAIYIVITKLNEAYNKEAQGMFRLWMDSIHCYCRSEEPNKTDNVTDDVKKDKDRPLNPPVILVGTWKDQIDIAEGEEIDNACMLRLNAYVEDVSEDACRHIRDDYIYFVSNKKDDNSQFQKIRADILKLARTLKTWNTDYPLKFIQLEKRIQQKRKELPIISFHQIKHLSIETSNPLNNEELTLFLKFHHEIRALIFFEDLPDYIILDTQWLSDAFKCIVTAEKFQMKVRTFKNKKKWDDLNQRGLLQSEVLDDIFRKGHCILSEHKDHILKVMEKFDIIICPLKSDNDKSNDNPCYYIPCMIKEEPRSDIYHMFNVTEETCKKSAWLCFRFSFLPPNLMNHLIASLCRRYEVAEVSVIQQQQTGLTHKRKGQISLFKGSAVFELQKSTKLQKLLVATHPNLIHIQIWEFKTMATIERGLYKHIANFVTDEINKIITSRFKMTNVKFEKKWECGLTKPHLVTGSNDFSEEQNTEYYCQTCSIAHKITDEWSNVPIKLNLSQTSEEPNPDMKDPSRKPTVISTKLLFTPGGLTVLSNIPDENSRTTSSRGLSKEEFNFAKMGMIVLNILADVLFDLLKQDKGNVKPRSECDITYLYKEHKNINRHTPSNSGGRYYPWGGTWQDIQNTDISTGDDIERIRLTRNEMQHSKTFKLDDTRFNDLCNIIDDLLKRFDQRINPAKLYTEQLKEMLSRTLSDEEVNGVQLEMAIEIEIEHQVNIPP